MNFRRGAIAGAIVALVLAAGIAARASDPMPTFLYVLAVGVAFGLVGLAAIAAIDRLRRTRSGE